MNISTEERAKILVQSLPYIQQHRGKTIVVKYGGNAMINEELKLAVMNDIVLMSLVGINVVLVHGGGPEINDMLKKIGKESRFVNGMRYTDQETMDIVPNGAGRKGEQGSGPVAQPQRRPRHGPLRAGRRHVVR